MACNVSVQNTTSEICTQGTSCLLNKDIDWYLWKVLLCNERPALVARHKYFVNSSTAVIPQGSIKNSGSKGRGAPLILDRLHSLVDFSLVTDTITYSPTDDFCNRHVTILRLPNTMQGSWSTTDENFFAMTALIAQQLLEEVFETGVSQATADGSRD